MTDRSKSVIEYDVISGAAANDYIVCWDTSANAVVLVTFSTLYGNTANVAARAFNVTPANNNAGGYPQGSILYDTSYIYVVTGANTIKRAALSTY